MNKGLVLTLCACFFVSILAIWPRTAISGISETHPSKLDSIYMVLASMNRSLPEKAVFNQAMQSMYLSGHQTDVLSIIDFTRPSNEKRFWIIDLKRRIVLHHTLVAHGKNSGELYANKFSNTPESNQSSLGLYVTGKTYVGKNGLSLKLHGLEPGVNDRAEERAIVIHSADYVSERFIKQNGRLGRSFGCPTIPVENHKEIINTLANGSCLYIHYTPSIQ